MHKAFAEKLQYRYNVYYAPFGKTMAAYGAIFIGIYMMRHILSTAVLLITCAASVQIQNPRAETPLHNENRPVIDGKMSPPSILLFSKTNDWRHNSGIAGGDYFFTDLADEQGRNVFITNNGAVFNDEDIQRFKLVIFNNASGDILNEAQQSAFQKWYESGGNVISLHGGNTIENWPWFNQNIRGPAFIGHIAEPQFQVAKLETLNAQHPVMKGVPREWKHSEEWYSFDGVPQSYGMTPLVGLHETSYSPYNFAYGDVSDLRMGYYPIEHPVIWTHCHKKGRSFYSALGHRHDVYDNEIYAKILRNAYDWMMRERDGKGC